MFSLWKMSPPFQLDKFIKNIVHFKSCKSYGHLVNKFPLDNTNSLHQKKKKKINNFMMQAFHLAWC